MKNLPLFDPGFPPGFSYFSGFITPDEEREIMTEITSVELHTFNFHGYEAKRRVASFGYDYSFDKRALSKGKEIPPVFHWLIGKVAAHIHIASEYFQELLVTEYPPGSVINWHRDAPPFDMIAGLSLASDCTFRLRPHDKSARTRASIISFPVARRSLYIIQGVARTDWEHSITPVAATRYSITLRTLKTPTVEKKRL